MFPEKVKLSHYSFVSGILKEMENPMRIRKPRFTPAELECLVDSVEAEAEVIKLKFSDTVTNEKSSKRG